MFTVADQDAALAFDTEKLGWEVRGDDRDGEDSEMRRLEVAPPGSELSAVDGVTITTPPTEMGGAPLMFSVAEPDGNHIWIVETSPG